MFSSLTLRIKQEVRKAEILKVFGMILALI